MKLNDVVDLLSRSMIREYTALAKKTPGCISLTLGEPDFDTPAEIEKEVEIAFLNKETHYIANNGKEELLEAISAFEQQHNNVLYKKDEIIVTSGATEALFVALFGILNPEDEVIVPHPAFSLYGEIVKMCRGKVVGMPTEQDSFQIREENMRRYLTPSTKAIILNSPNNPTGCIYDAESLETVYKIAKETGIFVICDDVYQQLSYNQKVKSFTSFTDLRQQIILVQSFSKPYAMTGWRMGYLAMDHSLKQRLELIHQFLVVSTPAPFQTACIKALQSDITPFLKTYDKRRRYVLQRICEMGLEVNEPQGAFYVFPSIHRFHLPSSIFCKRLILENGLAVTPGAAFGCEGYIRLTYCYSDEELQEGLDRLEAFVHKLEEEENGLVKQSEGISR